MPTAPPRSCSAREGNHCATRTSCSRAWGGRPSNCQTARSATPNAATIAVEATTPAALREKYRTPISPLIAAPMPGNSGMSQMSFISVWLRASRPHDVHLVDVDRFFVAIERQDDSEPDSGFGRRHGDHENGKHLTDHVVQLIRERHEIDVDG